MRKNWFNLTIKLKEYKCWDGTIGESVWICANADPPWFLNADPPDFSPKEGERSPFFAFIRNKWWDGPVRCAIPKICNSSCKFANITAFYTSLQPCQEEAQHRKRQIFDGFCDIWQILRTSRDFSSQAYWPSDDRSRPAVSLEIALLAPWLTFNLLDFFLIFLDFIWSAVSLEIALLAPWLTFNFPQTSLLGLFQRQPFIVFSFFTELLFSFVFYIIGCSFFHSQKSQCFCRLTMLHPDWLLISHKSTCLVSSNGSLLLCFLYSLSSHFLLCFASLAVPMFLLFYDGKLVWLINFIERSFFSSKIVNRGQCRKQLKLREGGIIICKFHKFKCSPCRDILRQEKRRQTVLRRWGRKAPASVKEISKFLLYILNCEKLLFKVVQKYHLRGEF